MTVEALTAYRYSQAEYDAIHTALEAHRTFMDSEYVMTSAFVSDEQYEAMETWLADLEQRLEAARVTLETVARDLWAA